MGPARVPARAQGIRAGQALVLGVLASWVMASGAQVYSWKDEAGQPHYGDVVPPRSTGAVRTLAAPRPLVYPTGSPSFFPEDREPLVATPPRPRVSVIGAESSSPPSRQQRAISACEAQRRVDCDAASATAGTRSPVVVVGGARPVVPVVVDPGLSGAGAGNALRGAGIMPGTFNGMTAVSAGNVVTFGRAPGISTTAER